MLASWTYEGWAMTEGAASHQTAPKPGALGTPRRRDLAALEERRIRAARLLREGVWPAEVARRGGGHRQSVSRGARKPKRGGERAAGGGGGTSGTFARGRPAARGGSVETGAGSAGVQEVDVGEGEGVD